jgi:hypothetical protein
MTSACLYPQVHDFLIRCLLLAVISNLLVEESSSNIWCLAFLYLVLLVLLACAVEAKPEIVAAR